MSEFQRFQLKSTLWGAGIGAAIPLLSALSIKLSTSPDYFANHYWFPTFTFFWLFLIGLILGFGFAPQLHALSVKERREMLFVTVTMLISIFVWGIVMHNVWANQQTIEEQSVLRLSYLVPVIYSLWLRLLWHRRDREETE